MINVIRDERDKEWIRRRQMRLVQVRKQSNDIAKQLRVRVSNDERERKVKKETEVEVKLELWKMKRLKDLEEMYRVAVNDVGSAHKLAIQEESNAENEEKKKINTCKAKARGAAAMDHVLREKREAIEKKLIPIQRKIMTRDIENLRSSLVRAIPAQKPTISRNISSKKPFNPKLFESSYDDGNLSCTKISSQEEKNEILEKKTILSSSDDHIRSGKLIPGKEKTVNKKTKQTKRKPDSPYKTNSRSDVNLVKSPKTVRPEEDTFWVNLGTIEDISEDEEDETNSKTGELKAVRKGSGKECQKDVQSKEKIAASKKKVSSRKEDENNVECYGYSIRHKCNFKGDVASVRRVDKPIEPDPVELARQEEKQLEMEKMEKESKLAAAAERGHKAIEKEKINRNYDELLAKLEKLSTKERILKSYCHIPPPDVFMSDERRRERSKRKQRLMNKKFEKIYYETMGMNPECATETGYQEGDSPESGKDCATRLDLVSCNPKTNSPASSSDRNDERKTKRANRIGLPVEKVSIKKTPSAVHIKRTKISKGEEIAIADIDRLLRKTRRLRQESQLGVERPPSECKLVAALGDRDIQKVEEKENVPTELSVWSDSSELARSVSLSPCEGDPVSDVRMEMKMAEDKKRSEPKKETLMDLGMGDLGRDFPGVRTNTIAWPVHQVTSNRKSSDDLCGRSSTTSYRSLPSQILPKRINSLLKLLVQLKEREGRSLVADELIVKMEETLDLLIKEAERSNLTFSKDDCREFQFQPQLNYYITKLLTMSRERIANLSVTSESDTSMQKMEDSGSCGRGRPNMTLENSYLKQMNKSSVCSNIKRAKELERIVKKWRQIMAQNCDESCQMMDEDMPSYPDNMTSDHDCSNYFDRYEEVSKRCSACISGLSDVLAGVRKDMPRGGECSGDENQGCPASSGHGCERVNETPKQECSRTKSPKSGKGSLPGFGEHDFSRDSTPIGERTIEDREQLALTNVYQGPIPDIMEEMMDRGLITSPFHWDGAGIFDRPASPCSGCLGCEHEMNKRKKKKKFQFRCRKSCRGACNGFPLCEEEEKPPPVDPEVLKQIRKKLEGIPMKYLDQRFGVYSPIPSPRPFPFPELGDDPEFIKQNFGKPLFGFPAAQPDPETKKPRQLNFKVGPSQDRPTSEPKMGDRSDFSGSESECPAGGMTKRPKSSPGGRQEGQVHGNANPQGNITFSDDSLECAGGGGGGSGAAAGGATFIKSARGGLDEKYFMPVMDESNDLDKSVTDHGRCGREEDNYSRRLSGHGFFPDMNEGVGQCGNERMGSRGASPACARACAVHCVGNNREPRHTCSGKDRVPSSRSHDRMAGSITNMSLFGENQCGRRTPGGCPYQGPSFVDDESCGNGLPNLNWAEDFL